VNPTHHDQPNPGAPHKVVVLAMVFLAAAAGVSLVTLWYVALTLAQ